MFSSFTSMLPSGINFSLNRDERERDRHDRTPQEQPSKPSVDSAPDESRKSTATNADEHGARRKKERSPNETFIVVRPPPSVSNHPLNLQLQLVPPQARERAVSGSSSVASNRQSVDLNDEVGVPLTREMSGRSGRSDPSSFYGTSSASSSSIASSASGASSVGGRRMIVPLYNLSAHNVLTNTVLDAGTDAKVAKLHKRGLEILALAVLECIEVWPTYGRGGYSGMPMTLNNMNVPMNGALEPSNTGALDLLRTPSSSAISLSSVGSHTPQPPLGSPSTPKPSMGASMPTTRSSLTTPTPGAGAKKIFGKIFKKKDSQGTPTPSGHSRGGSIDGRPFASPPTSDVGHGSALPVSVPEDATVSPAPSNVTFNVTAQQQALLQPSVLGIQPTLSAPVFPPVGRPTRYVWIVRKWLKNGDGGLLGGVMRGVNMVSAGINRVGLSDRISAAGNGTGNGSSGEMGIEVRFEWTRGQSKRLDRHRSAGQKALGKRNSVSDVHTAVRTRRSRRNMGENSGGLQDKSVSRDAPRRSGESRRSLDGPVRDSRANSITSASTSEEAHQSLKASGLGIPQEVIREDDGEDSDPEDSETPWSCTLFVSSIPSNPSLLWEKEHGGSVGEHRGSSSHLSHLSASDSAHGPDSTPRPNSSQGRPITPTPASTKSRPDPPGTLLKLKVGALSPAPHHPKVVAQLKVPFPLPDIEVENARIRKRVVTPAGVSRPAADDRPMSRGGVGSRSGASGPFGGGGAGVSEAESTVLTAEEIKDVLSCTAFWVVVREGFGGVGKEKRKGDGWRIRG